MPCHMLHDGYLCHSYMLDSLKTGVLLLAMVLMMVMDAPAQQSLRGYYVSYDGDTVVGDFINFRTAYVNPKKVQFLPLGRQMVVLTPDNCLSFALRGYDKYVARHINRLTNPLQLTVDMTSIDTASHYQGITTFLLLVFEAEGYRLYEYKDPLRNNYFIEEPDGDFYELVSKLTVADGRLVNEELYREQLRSIFAREIAANHRLQHRVSQLFYERRSLAGFMEQVLHNPLGSPRHYKSPDMVLSLGAVMPFTRSPGMYDEQGTVLLPGVGFVGYAKDLKKNFVSLKIDGFRQTFRANTGGNAYRYATYRMDLQLQLGRWLYENASFGTYVAAASGFLVHHASRENAAGRKATSDFVRPLLRLQGGVLLNDHLGFWFSASPIRFFTGDAGFFGGDYSQRLIAIGADWRLAL